MLAVSRFNAGVVRGDPRDAERRDRFTARAVWRVPASRSGEPHAEPAARSRLAAITSGGAIPETALFNVVLEPEGINVGTLDEDFAVESSAGDIMLLGNTSWRIRRVEGKSGRVLVEDAHGAAPTVPFWRGEAPARTNELSDYVGGLRQSISDLLAKISPVGVSQNNPDVAAAVAGQGQLRAG